MGLGEPNYTFVRCPEETGPRPYLMRLVFARRANTDAESRSRPARTLTGRPARAVLLFATMPPLTAALSVDNSLTMTTELVACFGSPFGQVGLVGGEGTGWPARW